MGSASFRQWQHLFWMHSSSHCQQSGSCGLRAGGSDSARDRHTEALVIFREIGDTGSSGKVFTALDSLACRTGQHTQAHVLLVENLALSRRAEDKKLRDCRRTAEKHRRGIDPNGHTCQKHLLDMARARLGTDVFQEVWEEEPPS